ncbi:leucine-rich repeat protein SHOC-2 [Chironomus tepperi]|uniref:leucine-rich repeat protein SHOC-2 n=1 Tax=Chironomus tepperi TaxID=113505 RepID=UPI00391F40EE
MATLLYTIFSFTAGASLHCAVRPEISPCTCAPNNMYANTISVTCEKMESFNHVVNVLQNKFTPDIQIWLRITHSQMLDFDTRQFAEMNMNIKNLRLNFNNLSSVPMETFQNLTKVEVLSLSDNAIQEVPRAAFEHMPNLGTLDIARGKIRAIRSNDFSKLKNLQTLVIASNEIELLEKDCFPVTLTSLHIGRNKVPSLNGTLQQLTEMKMLFINGNNLKTLDDELPDAPKLIMLMASHNHLEKLPKTLKNLIDLDTCYFNDNRLRSLDGLFSHRNSLVRLYLENNDIEYLAQDEFLKSENIDEIQLASNQISSLNKSLLYVTNLRYMNLSSNLLREFSMHEIYGLMKLRLLDLSHNRIEKLTGRNGNIAEMPSLTLLTQLLLGNNLLKSLDGVLAGLGNLRRLILSDNLLENIHAEDFERMEELEILDLSKNRLKSLEAFSKAYLPTLQLLNASHNLMTTTGKDFHGLPVLCTADLSNNEIASMGVELVSNTRCSNHGVVAKLEILLQENPVLCDENLPHLVGMFEMYHARLTGIATCIVPQHLPIPVDSISNNLLQQPPLELLASIMQPNQLHPLSPNQMSMIQAPSIVQIIVPANSIPGHGSLVDKPNIAPISTTAATTINNNDLNDTRNDDEYSAQTQEPLRSSIPQVSSTPYQEIDREDDIDEMVLNEEDSSDYQENEERSKKQRDRSDFRYVESFEGEKSNIPVRRYEPDSESELKNVINENFSQVPSVLPVPKALSSPKDTSSSTELLDEPPEPIQDNSTSDI